MRKIIFLFLVLCAYHCSHRTNEGVIESPSWDEQHAVERIAFGSCNKVNQPQIIWEAVMDNEADLWIWTGDIIYGDTDNMPRLKQKYDRMKQHEAYAKFRKHVPVIGIWDDHDYGVNDGDRTYSMRAPSRDILFDFLDVPEDNPARKRSGAYQSYVIGEENKKVKIILLDARYFRDPLQKDHNSKHRYLSSRDGDILGEEQWKWLRDELTNSEAQIHLIVSGVQIIPTEHYYEKWANFPRSRDRLFDLINECQPAHPILISGDRHMAEISAVQLDNYKDPLYEVTSSGMTHTWSDTTAREGNSFRVAPQIVRKNFGIIEIDWKTETLHSVKIISPKNDVLLNFNLNQSQ